MAALYLMREVLYTLIAWSSAQTQTIHQKTTSTKSLNQNYCLHLLAESFNVSMIADVFCITPQFTALTVEMAVAIPSCAAATAAPA
jgi:hypothetical protein